MRMRVLGSLCAAALGGLLLGCGAGGAGGEIGSNHQQLAMARPTADGAYLRQTISRGANFHATNGIRVGADGNYLYVASVLGRSISVVDRRSGMILDRIGTERGVESPDDLAFGPDGSLYWTSFFTGEIGRLTPAGQKITVARVGPGANAIAFSASGRLFVTRVFLGDHLYEVDPDGLNPPRLILAGMGGLNAMDFGPDGLLYGPLWFKGQVARIDVDTGALTVAASGFGTPAAVKFDSLGRLHVADQARGQVVRLEADGTQTLIAQLPVTGIDNLAFDASDRLYTTNSHDGSLTEILPNEDGRLISKPGMVAPGGLAVVPSEDGPRVYVPDSLSMKVFDGHEGEQIGDYGAIIGVTPLATPLTASPDGANLVLSSWFANVVQVFDPATGTVLQTHRDFAVPLNAVRFQGDLVVSEAKTGSVSRKGADGIKAPIASGLLVPAGLAVRGGDLFATEWIRGRVLQLAENGSYLATPREVATGLAKPEGIAADADGSLLVVETGLHRLVRVDAATGAVAVVEDNLDLGLPAIPGAAPTFIFNGVAVGECGVVYLTLDSPNELVRLSPRGSGAPGCYLH